MRQLRAFLMRLRGLCAGPQADRDFQAELDTHLQMHIDDNLRAGMSPAQARRQALLRLGGLEQTRQAHRDRRTLPLLEALLRDARQALRQLRKSPAFTLTALLTLALGIGATAAIFTLVYDVLLRPLPYRNPGRLVVIEEKIAEARNGYPRLPANANHFGFWQRHSRTLQSLALMEPSSLPLGAGQHPHLVNVLLSTPGIFSVLSTGPQIGRAFTAAEDRPGYSHVIVLGYPLWQHQFAADPRVLGRTVTLNGFPYTVIGVMPRSFHFSDLGQIPNTHSTGSNEIEAIIPIALSPARLAEEMWDFNYFALARLKPGISVPQATAEIDALQHAISTRLPASERATLSAVLTPFQENLTGSNRKPLFILLGAVVALLLTGCLNLANLLLARAVNRQRELAVISALGATRLDLLRASMREILVLGSLGGLLGILLAAALVPFMQRYLPPVLDFRGPVHLDWAGALCALSLAAATMLLAGSAPAWMSSRTRPNEVLHSESGLASDSRATRRLRKVLVASEVAISVALVLLTSLLTVSLARLMHVSRGFDVTRTLAATVELPLHGYEKEQDRARFYQAVLNRLHRLPGVDTAAAISILPLNGEGWGDSARLLGDTRPAALIPGEHFRWISPGYFHAIHLPLLAGRDLTPDDQGRNLALVSQRTARTLWPGKNPIGQHFWRGDPSSPDEKPFTVIGVVADARTVSLAAPDPMLIYVPFWYRADFSGGLIVRTRLDPRAMADAIRKAVWSLDPAVSVPAVQTLGRLVTDSVASRRFEMDVLLLFALTAFLLAGLGIYGVITYSVLQRRREIGLRLALGAQRARIYRLVLGEGLVPVAIGAAAGTLLAFAFGHLLGSLLFQVSPYSPFLALLSVSILIALGIFASFLPARHAASIDPMQALRTE